MTCKELIKLRKQSWAKYQDIKKDKELRQVIADDYIMTTPSIRKELIANPELMIEMFFVIVNKEMETVPFFLNSVQSEFLRDLTKSIKDYDAGRRVTKKFLVLKGRQQGFTSVITAYQLACVVLNRNFQGFTLADETENTAVIFEDKAKFTFDQLPAKIKPTIKRNNRKELTFSKIHSRWRVHTAGSKNIGRSKILNFFHGSEAGFWPHGIRSILASLGPALTKDSIIVLESTANGYNDFKDLWDEENNWTNLFYAWWRTPEYSLKFESKRREKWFKMQTEEDHSWIFERCKWLVDFHQLSWDQVYWYYHQYLDLKDLIKQEYPCSADEAFLASGACVFDKEIVIQRKQVLLRQYAEKPYKVGRFAFEWHNPDTQDFILDDTIRWVEDPNGYVRIYEDREYGVPYVIGGDTKGEGKDFYAGTAINNSTGKRVATVRHTWSHSKPYTWQMYCLGRYYNDALIGIEMNFNTAPIEELQRLGYTNQYMRQKYDTYEGVYQKAFGWRTDGNTRPLIIDKEIDLISNNIDLFTDITMLDECLTFIYDKNGRPDAEVGKHDDLLFSDMIANEIRGQQTTSVVEPRKERTELQKDKDRLARKLKRQRRLA